MSSRHVLGEHSGTWKGESVWEGAGATGRPHVAARSGRVLRFLHISTLSSANQRRKLGPLSLQG